MGNTMWLNGRLFRVHKSKYAEDYKKDLARHAYRSIYQCYTKPSEAKVAIYKDWEEWAYLNDVEYFGVSGYSCFQFSLQGLVQHNGHTYILHITKDSNKAYIVE